MAAKPLQMETWLLLPAYENSPTFYPMVPSPTPYNLPFSHNAARRAYRNALYNPLRSSKVNMISRHLKTNMRLPVSDQ